MVVHWAGEKSNVIVALARDSLSLARPRSSDVSIGVALGFPLCSQDTLFSSVGVMPEKLLGAWGIWKRVHTPYLLNTGWCSQCCRESHVMCVDLCAAIRYDPDYRVRKCLPGQSWAAEPSGMNWFFPGADFF